MDNDSRYDGDLKENSRQDSSDDLYMPKKKLPTMSDKSGKRSVRKSRFYNDGSAKDNESRSRAKAKQFDTVGIRPITDYLGFSTTITNRTKGLKLVDERQASLEDLDAKLECKEREIDKLGKEVEGLQRKLLQGQQALTDYKKRTHSALISVLLELYSNKREERLALREDIVIFKKSLNNQLCAQQGRLLVKNRAKIEELQTEIRHLEDHPVKRRSKSKSSIDKEEENEVRLGILKTNLAEAKQQQKRLNKTYTEVLQRRKLALSELESQMYKQNWPLLAGRYQPLELVGKGGFSQVYRGFDLEENTEVAIKLSFAQVGSSNQQVADYFKHIHRECHVQRKLKHPNINRLIDVHTIKDKYTHKDGMIICIVEMCEGTDLSFYLKQNVCLSEKEARNIIRQIVSALYYLSTGLPEQIIHYDLKPQNIMIHGSHIKIIDFGLCKLNNTEESKIELTSQGTGTYWYLPPETFDETKVAKISSNVDIWSTGVIFYELLFGKRPFGDKMSQTKIMNDGIIANVKGVVFDTKSPKDYPISEEAKNFIRECLNPDQEARLSVKEAYNHTYFKNHVRS